jgi:hypothetical protein
MHHPHPAKLQRLSFVVGLLPGDWEAAVLFTYTRRCRPERHDAHRAAKVPATRPEWQLDAPELVCWCGRATNEGGRLTLATLHWNKTRSKRTQQCAAGMHKHNFGTDKDNKACEAASQPPPNLATAAPLSFEVGIQHVSVVPLYKNDDRTKLPIYHQVTEQRK